MLNSRINLEQVHFNYRIEFVKATHATTLARISIHIPSEKTTSENNQGQMPTGVEVFGRISKPSGWIVDAFEGKVNRDGQCNSGPSEPDCEFNVAIVPGTYRLAIAVKNVANGEAGTLYTTTSVPAYDEIDVAKPDGQLD